MTTLAANLKRVYEFNEDPILNDIPMVASDIIYEGAAVGETSGIARPFTSGDDFLGFAVAKADNSSGAASAITVRVRQQGTVKLTIAGTLAASDLGAPIYLTDDNTFSKTNGGSDTVVGRLSRFISTTVGMVRFEALPVLGQGTSL